MARCGLVAGVVWVVGLGVGAAPCAGAAETVGAAAAAKEEGPAVDAARLPGTWELKAPDFSNTLTFARDGTYALKMTGLLKREESGTWKLDGGKLTVAIRKSTVPARVGQTRSWPVRELTAARLVLQESEEKAVTFARAK